MTAVRPVSMSGPFINAAEAGTARPDGRRQPRGRRRRRSGPCPDSMSRAYGVLAECGHVTHAGLDVGEGGRRQQRLGLRVLGADGAPAVSLPQLRVFEDLVEVFDLRGGDACRGQAGVEFGGASNVWCARRRWQSHSWRLRTRATLVANRGSSASSGTSKTSVTSVAPAAVVLHADEDLRRRWSGRRRRGRSSCGSGPFAVAGLPVCICV